MASNTQYEINFHTQKDSLNQQAATAQNPFSPFVYRFENFFHPFVGELIEKVNKKSIVGLLDADFHESLKTPFFDDFYASVNATLVKINSFDKEIDVSESGPYANYNWELLFHIPLTIAVHLSKNQRFAEAQRWFHYIFDLTHYDEPDSSVEQFWKFVAFRDGNDVTQIDELLALLSKPASESTSTEDALKEKILDGYEAIRNKPFRPHAVARTRHVAYQYCVVMKYLDNLIAWGDSLFRQDTLESINEATQLYVLAANLLGQRPQRIPSTGAVRPKTFAQLKAKGLDAIGNALVELEGQFPLNLGLPQTQGNGPLEAGPLFGIGPTLYFCIPRNEKLLGYWDTVADRLFKLRHCMNIEGVVRQLALFDPPIDPGMLVKAVAAGIDIGSIVSGLNQPVGPVRSILMIQKSLELAGEVRNLGSALLSAIEKGDAEHMALVRQGHETRIQEMAQEVRFLQWKQTQESTESLLRSRKITLERYNYYQRLLDLTPDEKSVPDSLSPDRRSLTEGNFEEVYADLVEQYDKTIEPEDYPQISLKKEGKLKLHEGEYDEMIGHADRAFAFRIAASATDAVTAGLSMIPDLHVKMAPMGSGTETRLFGGEFLAHAGKAVTSGLNILAQNEEWQGHFSSKTATYTRRADDWILQSNLAARELVHIGRQIIGSLIAEQVAYRDFLNVRKLIEQSNQADQFLREKFSNEELYTWMQGEISRLYYEYYRFAFDTARKAEQSMKRELARPEVDSTDYVKFNYWDGGRKGLLSGEALYFDIKRMELAYHENNKREFELVKHVSLRQLEPTALLRLRATGSCEVTVPEWLFDLDNPGHYMRRIKNVSLSIPSVAGPYTSVSCTLSLVRSSRRNSPVLKDDEYARQGLEDDRFSDYFGTVQSIVTSSGNDDDGMFDFLPSDERLLPFEGAGAESVWKLELPRKFRQFDYNTISDVIVHLRYTARQGGALLGDKAIQHMTDRVGVADTSELAIMFGLRHEFPNDWHRFLTAANADFITNIQRGHFPYFTQGWNIIIDAIQVFAIQDGALESLTPSGLNEIAMRESFTDGLQDGGTFELSITPDGQLLVPDKNANVFVLLQYSLEPS